MEIQQPEIFRRHTAYHESGHVIADLLFGYRFKFVTIKPDEFEGDNGVVYGNAKGRACDLAVVQLAGIVASAKMIGCDPWENPYLFDNNSTDIATILPLPTILLITGLNFSLKFMANLPTRNRYGMRLRTKPGCW